MILFLKKVCDKDEKKNAFTLTKREILWEAGIQDNQE